MVRTHFRHPTVQGMGGSRLIIRIVTRYGESACPIPRKIIARGTSQVKGLELFPPRLYVHILVEDRSGVTPNPPAEIVISAAHKMSEVHAKLLDAVFPGAHPAEYRIWSFLGRPADTRYVTPRDCAERQVTEQLENSEESVEGVVEDLDSFVVEVRSNGKWLMPDPAAGASGSQQTEPADDQPLFKNGSDFFSKLQTKPAAQTQLTKPATPSRDPRPAPKVCSILPGTLGLGNMCVFHPYLAI